MVDRLLHPWRGGLESIRTEGITSARRLAFMPINHLRIRDVWAAPGLMFFLLTLLLLTTMFLVGIAAPREEVFRQKYTFAIRNRRTLVCDSVSSS